jgi:hypothetical protein
MSGLGMIMKLVRIRLQQPDDICKDYYASHNSDVGQQYDEKKVMTRLVHK